MADRLSAYAPKTEPTVVAMPAPVSMARAGGLSYPKVRSTANPGTFCPAIVTT